MSSFVRYFAPALCCALVACSQAQTNQQPQSPLAMETVPTVDFSADTAWQYVSRQVAFGPRVPDTDAHAKCLDFLCQTLSRHGAKVEVQQGTMKYFDGKPAPVKNVIASYLPQKRNRILLAAHWDCRRYSDYDPDPSKRNTPVMGANDGASGVGVLLEVARQINIRQPQIGVDIVLFDNEDNGTPSHLDVDSQVEDSWCLGSQLWAKELGKQSAVRFGILLDMVGAKNALFYREKYSLQSARQYVDKIWNTALELGYGNFFVAANGGYILDDHYYVNQIAGIPMVDIIQTDPTSATGFAHYWHTQDDVIDNVDRSTLEAVGRTVLTILYNEK